MVKEWMWNDGFEFKFLEVRVMMVVVISNIFVMWSVYIFRDVDIIVFKVRVEFFIVNIRMVVMVVVVFFIRFVIFIFLFLFFGWFEWYDLCEGFVGIME